MKKLSRNEQGMTLIEVVAAIIILSIILITFFNFFTNSALFNNKNDNNIKAMNITREQIVNFNKTYNTRLWDDIKVEFTEDPTTPDIYTKEWREGNYIIEVSIDSNKESGDYYRELRKVRVRVWKDIKEGPPLSESFTYQEGVN